MTIIGYIIAGFLCLAFVPIAFPVLIIVAIVHMLDGKKKERQKRIIVEALKEAGVSPQVAVVSASQETNEDSKAGTLKRVANVISITLGAIVFGGTLVMGVGLGIARHLFDVNPFELKEWLKSFLPIFPMFIN